MAALLWLAKASNVKTGPIPTCYVREAERSCKGCPLRKGRCYAWNGTPVMGFRGMLKSSRDYSLEHALDHRLAKAKAVRFGALGDPARIAPAETLAAIKAVRAKGLGVLGYTHFPDEVPEIFKLHFLASTNNVYEADKRIEQGWFTATILPADWPYKTFFTPAGNKGIVCPAQIRDTNCNDCRLCDPHHPVAKHVRAIGFLDHSPATLSRMRRLPRVAAA